VNLIHPDYYGAYDEMIQNLAPLLLIPQQNPRLVERLDFRPDLPRGSRKLIYKEIARLLQSGFSVLARGYSNDDLFWWLADEKHSNLSIKFQSVKRLVYQEFSAEN
jgi:hypothetical protein